MIDTSKLNEKLNKIEEDLHSILTMETEPAYRAGALKEYKRTLDLGAALKLHADLAAMAQKEKEEQLAKERKEQETILEIKKKFGKNAILKGMNLEDAATTRERNRQIGGHKSGE